MHQLEFDFRLKARRKERQWHLLVRWRNQCLWWQRWFDWFARAEPAHSKEKRMEPTENETRRLNCLTSVSRDLPKDGLFHRFECKSMIDAIKICITHPTSRQSFVFSRWPLSMLITNRWSVLFVRDHIRLTSFALMRLLLLMLMM